MSPSHFQIWQWDNVFSWCSPKEINLMVVLKKLIFGRPNLHLRFLNSLLYLCHWQTTRRCYRIKIISVEIVFIIALKILIVSPPLHDGLHPENGLLCPISWIYTIPASLTDPSPIYRCTQQNIKCILWVKLIEYTFPTPSVTWWFSL